MYIVKDRLDSSASDWESHVRRVNEDQAYCKGLHFSDYKNHANVNLLPSYHPYWSFKVYLGTKRLIINTLRTLNTYYNMLADPMLSVKTSSAIAIVVDGLERNVSYFKNTLKQQQLKLTKEDENEKCDCKCKTDN